MQPIIIEEFEQVDDGIGGYSEDWAIYRIVRGYLDLVSGTDLNTIQNAVIEQSTHMVIIPDFVKGITDKMRVIDSDGRWYSITYADDPVGQRHHNELYIKFGGVLDEL